MTSAAYETCLRLARRHYENFPVASWLLPPRTRPHIAAIYAFARVADDFADEGQRAPAERLMLLDDWRLRLHAAAAGRPGGDASEAAHIFTALAESMETCRLPVELFDDLLSAFRQDVVVTRYETWDDLLDYCRRSANPVGRLVLRVAGYDSPELDVRSDAVCSALQLTNFWQDLAQDWTRGRLYVPLEWLRAHGAELEDLGHGRLSPAWRATLAEAARRTRHLFDEGQSISDSVRGRLRWELRATWLGGRRILDRLEAADFDVFRRRPRLGWPDAFAIGWHMIGWRTAS